MSAQDRDWKLLWFLIPLLTFMSFVYTLWIRASVPTRAEWGVAIEHIRSHLKEDDRITWYPEWAGEGRLFLHDLPAFYLPFKGEVDLGHARRLWVIGAFGYEGSDLLLGAHLKPLQKLSVISKKQLGDLSVHLLRVESGGVLASLYDDLSSKDRVKVYRSAIRSKDKAVKTPCQFWGLNGWHCVPQSSLKRKERRAKERRAKETEKCLSRPLRERLRRRSKRRDLYTLDRRRYLPYVDCGLHPTEHISRDERVIGEEPRQCLWFAPHHRREVELQWTIDAETLNQQEREMLWFEWGWEDLSIRHPFRKSKAQPLHITLELDGQKLWENTLNPTYGWSREMISLTSNLKRETHSISVRLRALQNVQDASLCVNMSVRSPR